MITSIPDRAKMIEAMDTRAFDRIGSQTSEDDRRSLLAIQNTMRSRRGEYSYIEIGSYLGGSLQPHLIDPCCRRIYSIDLRPDRPSDIRAGIKGIDSKNFEYQGNTHARMLENLASIASDQVSKIICFDTDARHIDPASIDDPPHLCFIDGEHTVRAVQSDFNFCRSVCRPDALICFHDAQLIYEGIGAICRQLREDNIAFSSAMLSGTVFVIALGDTDFMKDSRILRLTRNSRAFFLGARLNMFYKQHLNGAGKSFVRPAIHPLLRLAGLEGIISRNRF